ncbi:MAG: hypothetical protein DPW09_17830 [Anaerolineae bacterium]|nr:hypothetical protein [Anaerolineales bacterium]MCQ3975306.1 hypothetical protein [Anaerolineae bacterium]
MEQLLINFLLMGEEAKALRKLSLSELRKPVEQVRWILRKELEEKGYLPPQTLPPTKPHEAHHEQL